MKVMTTIFSLTSGTLLFLSFPKFDYHFLVWIFLIPLLIALRKRSISDSFRIGFLTGLVYNIGITYWVVFVIVRYGYLPLYVGVVIMVLLALYLSMYVAIFAAGVTFLRKRGIAEIIAAPLLWTSLEYGKSHLLTGFPWENLAYALHENLSMIQIADITGIYGITFVIVVVNCVFFQILTMEKSSRTKTFVGIAIGIGLVVAVFGYGQFRLKSCEKQFQRVREHDVAIIQGDIDQSIKWNSGFQSETLDIYRAQSFGVAVPPKLLIVWPETATPFFFQTKDEKQQQVIDIAKATQSYLLFGSPSYADRHTGRVFMNSAYLISPAGEITGKYDKVHLVPYGEYVPLREFFFFLEKLVVGVGDFVPGKNLHPLALGKEKVGVLICYEGIFPSISREYRKKGATLLINITNDAWFGTSSAPYQHLTMTAFRAVENRMYILRAANTGISAIIAPSGDIISSTELFKRTSLEGKIKFIECRTFYSTYGNVFIYLCLIALAGIMIISMKRRNVYD